MMTIEEKAKAYDEALEKVKKCSTDKYGTIIGMKPSDIFQELAESEDEKIRNSIIQYIQHNHPCKSNWIAWLEKQGEQKLYTFNAIPRLLEMIKPTNKTKVYCQKLIDSLEEEGYKKDVEIVSGILKQWNGEEIPMATMDEQGEQKPTDKIEPKFKVGDWVVNKFGDVWHIDSFDKKNYQVSNGNEYNYFPIYKQNEMHLWTIQDAKDGDVLVTLDYILIFKKFLKNDGGISYCHYDFGAENPQFIWLEDKNWYFGKEAIIHPATKEQRDLLFQKMKEADYEWDAEKKELKKIEPKFKVGDWIVNNNGESRCFQVVERSWPDSKIKRAEDNLESFLNTATLDKQYHLWTIEDVKSGDILAVDPYFDIEEYPFPFVAIYKSRGSNFFNSYCFTSFEGIFDEQGGSGHILDMLHPATKEQRDFLFQKMKEANYNWNAEKLELKKIKQHHIAWNEEDEKIYSRIYDLIHAAAYANYDIDEDGKELGEYAKITNWLKSLKDRIQSKQELNEDDIEEQWAYWANA